MEKGVPSMKKDKGVKDGLNPSLEGARRILWATIQALSLLLEDPGLSVKDKVSIARVLGSNISIFKRMGDVEGGSEGDIADLLRKIPRKYVKAVREGLAHG